MYSKSISKICAMVALSAVLSTAWAATVTETPTSSPSTLTPEQQSLLNQTQGNTTTTEDSNTVMKQNEQDLIDAQQGAKTSGTTVELLQGSIDSGNMQAAPANDQSGVQAGDHKTYCQTLPSSHTSPKTEAIWLTSDAAVKSQAQNYCNTYRAPMSPTQSKYLSTYGTVPLCYMYVSHTTIRLWGSTSYIATCKNIY